MSQIPNDLQVVSAPTSQPTIPDDLRVSTPADLKLATQDGDRITPQNYGQVAAARIQQARNERQAKGGGDLNQNEQAAIMDTYREAANLPMLSNQNSFQEAQQHIAKRQGNLLNLARSTSAAFERQAVNMVAPIVDEWSPEWGTHTRQNIAAMNPFDPDRVTGKAGGVVASLPLLLAGGSIPKAAAIFGLQSTTESLANSDDVGRTGLAKWLPAVGDGVITAAATLAGGKLAQWASESLGSRIPQIAQLLKAGDRATAGQIIAREAVQAGINLPPQAVTMMTGTIANNLLAQQTTDPQRQWSDGLEETAYNAVAMTLGNHIVRAADAIKSAPGGDLISGAPTGVAPAPGDHPAGRNPVIVHGVAVPDTGGTGLDPETAYVSKAVPRTININGVPVDAPRMIGFHETMERHLEDGGMSDDEAHAHATESEHAILRRAGVDPAAYEEALKPIEAAAAKDSLTKAPADLDQRPYAGTTPAIPPPPGVETQEREIHQTPAGYQVNTPHVSYVVADNMGEETSKNIWVRPHAGPDNTGRQLLIQFSSDLINAGRPRTTADDFGDKLYSGSRPGYARPSDFWELPQWIATAAHSLPNSDVYVVRDLDEAKRFIAQAKYGTVAMSALDVNSKLAQGLIDGYEGKVAVGGYTDMTPFKGRANVKVYSQMPDFVKDQGFEYKDGVDYRHFRGTEVIPRLALSKGCLHNCDFCGVEGKGHAPEEVDKKVVDQQVKAFGDLKSSLVYINDKTFGQAKNHQDIIDIGNRLKAANPDFKGFVIQTSAAQMAKMTPEFLREGHVAYVEMGVESYNNDILKSVKKPANEKMIDDAVAKIRASGAAFIPNVMIGLPGETPETYQRTLDFLGRNKDVISHVNAYNTALYDNSELGKKLGGAKLETDRDENVTAKSWQTNPSVDQDFHDKVMAFGSEALGKPPGEPPKGTETGGVSPGGENLPARLDSTIPVAMGHGLSSVPPRPPNVPPPPMGSEGQPEPDEPARNIAGHLTGAVLEAYTGDTRSTWNKLGDAMNALYDGIRRYSGKMFPTVTRLNRIVGEKLGIYVSAPIFAVEKSAELSRRIIGSDDDLDLKVGTLLSEDQLRSIKAAHLQLPSTNVQGGKFTQENLRDARPTQVQIEKALKINTFIGKEGSPFQTEAEYQAALSDPKIQAALNRVRQHYGPLIDDMFRKAMGLDPDAELAARGFQTGIRTNLMARDPNDTDRKGMIVTGSRRGNLRNPNRGKTPFSREATGTGEAYEGRMSKIIENSIGRTADTSFKNDAIKSLIESGIAKVGPRGQLVSIGKYATKALPLSGGKDLYIRTDAYKEVRAAFDVDSPDYNGLLKGVGQVLNKIALASVSEAAYHLGNQASALVRAPGVGLVIPQMLRKTWGLLTHDLGIMAQAADLAKIGAWRGGIPEDQQGGKLYKYTLGIMGRVINMTDKAGRLVMDDAFKKLSGPGGPGLNTETNRRDFVNQLGQYNSRAQSRIVKFVRDTSIGPFATAGTNFYSLGIKSLILSSGMQAKNLAGAAELRVRVAGRFAAILGTVALVNYLRWGRVDGGDQVPIGAIKLDDGPDGKVRYFDIASLFNITRGLRAVGARAMIEGPRQGKTQPEIVHDAARDVITSALSPFEGPIVKTATIAISGKDQPFFGYPVGPKIAKDENEVTAHLKAAILAANPIISKLTGTTQSPIAGKFEVQSRDTRSVAMQIALREAAASVPPGQQTRAEMNQSAAERTYRDEWAKGNKIPLISAYQRGEIDLQRAHELIHVSTLSPLAQLTHSRPIDTALRIYDAGTLAEKADLKKTMLLKFQDLHAKSPQKAVPYIKAYRDRGLFGAPQQ